MVSSPSMVSYPYRRRHQLEISSLRQARFWIRINSLVMSRSVVRIMKETLIQYCPLRYGVAANRNPREHDYMTFKVYETGNRQGANEIAVLQHLRPLLTGDNGNKFVRSFEDSFEIPGPVGPHTCLIYKPLCLSFEDLRFAADGKLPPLLLKPLIYGVLCGFDYLHRRANIVHTGETFSGLKNYPYRSWH